MPPTLSRTRAEAFYDRFGARQDDQAWYEDPPLEEMIAAARFGAARSVVELGCGTGRLARRLLSRDLPAEATWRGFDLSATMVALARRRLARFGARARVEKTDGEPVLPLGAACCDRYVATYVADLLSHRDIDRMLADAHRLLVPGGLLAAVSLTRGSGLPSRLVSAAWTVVHRLRPALVGGCRPVELAPRLGAGWEPVLRRVVVAWGVPSEVVVACRRER